MAIGFNQTKGSAQKEKIETYNYAGKEDHHLRMVGDLLPRYVYWLKGENGKNIPMECLSFDRNTETFNNKEPDHVREFYPDLKCGRSYAIQCIDYGDKAVKVLNLKVVKVMSEDNILIVRGSVPGHNNSYIIVQK